MSIDVINSINRRRLMLLFSTSREGAACTAPGTPVRMCNKYQEWSWCKLHAHRNSGDRVIAASNKSLAGKSRAGNVFRQSRSGISGSTTGNRNSGPENATKMPNTWTLACGLLVGLIEQKKSRTGV